MDRNTKVNEIENAIGISFPSGYRQKLIEGSIPTDFEFQNSYWLFASLFSEERKGWASPNLTLDSGFSIDMKPDIPFIKAISMFVDSYLTDLSQALKADDGTKFSAERLKETFCVAEEENGDYLFIDSENQGVYAFYHDGFDIEKLSDSIDDFLSFSNKEVASDIQEEQKPSEIKQTKKTWWKF